MQTIAKIGARNSWRAHKLRRSRQEQGAGRMRDWTMTNSCTYTHSWRNKTCADWEWTCTTSSNPSGVKGCRVLQASGEALATTIIVLSSICKHYCIREHINSYVRSTCISPYTYFMERFLYGGRYLTNQFEIMTWLFGHASNKWKTFQLLYYWLHTHTFYL